MLTTYQIQQIKSNQNLLSLVLHYDNHIFLYGDAHEDIQLLNICSINRE